MILGILLLLLTKYCMVITVVCAAAAVFIYRVTAAVTVVDISLLVNSALLTTALLHCKDKCWGKTSSDFKQNDGQGTIF